MALFCSQVSNIKKIIHKKLLHDLTLLSNSNFITNSTTKHTNILSNLSYKTSIQTLDQMSLFSNNTELQNHRVFSILEDNIKQKVQNMLDNNSDTTNIPSYITHNEIIFTINVFLNIQRNFTIIKDLLDYINKNKELFKYEQLLALNNNIIKPTLNNSNNSSTSNNMQIMKLLNTETLKSYNLLNNKKSKRQIKANIMEKFNIPSASNTSSSSSSNINSTYDCHYDPENELIVLQTKNCKLTLVEIQNKSINDIDLYKTLVSNMEAKKVLINNEPYEYYSGDTSSNSNNSRKYNMVDTFNSIEDIHKVLDNKKEYKIKSSIFEWKNNRNTNTNKSASSSSTSTITRNNLYDQVFSLIYYCVNNKNIPVELLEMPVHVYMNSFVSSYSTNQSNKINTKYNNNFELLSKSLLNLDLYTYISYQERLGCKKCASFLNKKKL